MYHKLIVIGNLGSDPELRHTPQGQAVCNFSLASNRQWASQEGEIMKETTWFRVAVWGRLAEICHRYLAKGRLVMVEGRLTPDRDTGNPRIWIDQSGEPKASFDLTALEVRFLTGGPAEVEDVDPGEAENALSMDRP